MDLPFGRRLRFTTGSWLTPLGRSLQRARDRLMAPLPEDVDTFPRVQTAQGRSLVNGGGIFPDLTIQDDTLLVVERDFLRATAEIQLPIGLRIAEFGLAVAATREAEGAVPDVTDEEFQRFVHELLDEGVEAFLLADSLVREYLLWRTKLTVAQRMDDIAAEAAFRVTRDPVLAEAIRLLQESSSQADLFHAVDSEEGQAQAPSGS
jgi:hypothetical protein